MSFNSQHNGLGGDRDDGGFTMIELVIVVAIVGILASIVVFAMQSQQRNAVHAACVTDTRTIVEAQEASKTLTGYYSTSMASLAPKFIRSTPRNTDHYVITTDISGTVYVASAAGGPAEPVTSQPDPCGSIT